MSILAYRYLIAGWSVSQYQKILQQELFMTSVDPAVVRGVELVDRERPVDVRTYAERGTLVIGFLAPGVWLQLDEAKQLRAAIDVHIQRMEIFTATHRPQVGPART